MDLEPVVDITCPHCFEVFELAAPPPTELPESIDYDCEVCCRPMLIDFVWDGERVAADAAPAH